MRRLVLAAIVLVAGAVTYLVPTVLSSPTSGAGFALSSALAGAPRGLVMVAVQAGRLTQQDPNVLLAIAKVETDWGQAQNGEPDDLVSADIQAHVNVAALQPGGVTAALLGLAGGRRVEDWVNPQPVGPAQEHAMGFTQFLPSTWRAESAAAPGRLQRANREFSEENQRLRSELTEIGSALGSLTGGRHGQGRRGAAALALPEAKPRRTRRPITDPEVLAKRSAALVKARAARAQRLAAARAGTEAGG